MGGNNENKILADFVFYLAIIILIDVTCFKLT